MSRRAPARRRARALLGLLPIVAVWLGCGDGRGCGDGCGDGCGNRSATQAAVALARVEPHAEAFEAYARWARRVLVADPALRDRAAFEEAAFAPIRRDEAVLGAFIVRPGRPAQGAAFGRLEALPDGVAWVRVRSPSLGAIEVATLPLPDPRSADATPVPAVVVRRALALEGGVAWSLAVAYRDDQGAERR